MHEQCENVNVGSMMSRCWCPNRNDEQTCYVKIEQTNVCRRRRVECMMYDVDRSMVFMNQVSRT